MRDAVIIGAGPVGLLCAALLAQRGLRCCVLDARPLEQARRDARLLALSRGSWEILAPVLGADLPPRAPIREVWVSSAGDFGTTRITADDFGGHDLGATVLYGDLLAALAAAVAPQPTIEVLRPVAASEVRQRFDRVEVRLADGSLLAAELAIHAEGGTAPQTDDRPRDGEDWAVLGSVRLRPARADLPAGTAFERFTRDGPLALLPTPTPFGAGEGRALSLVWCMKADDAQRRIRLPERALLGELQSQLGSRIATVTAIGPLRAVALPQRLRDEVHHHRMVALGNAAQTLHPVAGQGFNLGVRDCVTLADEIAQGPPLTDALARYARRRRTDRAVISTLTGSLPALFASHLAPLAIGRGLGLALLDVVPALRREFAELLMFGVRS